MPNGSTPVRRTWWRMSHQETALPVEPRLSKAELPRTTNQLRQAAAAARDGSWQHPTIDVKANIRSVLRADRSGRRVWAE